MVGCLVWDAPDQGDDTRFGAGVSVKFERVYPRVGLSDGETMSLPHWLVSVVDNL